MKLSISLKDMHSRNKNITTRCFQGLYLTVVTHLGTEFCSAKIFLDFEDSVH